MGQLLINVSSSTLTPDLHSVVLGLRDALGSAELWPVPVTAVITPPPPLAHQHIARVTVELDLGARGEGERGLSAIPGCRQLPAGDYLDKAQRVKRL